jgi:hypothetical protein
MTDLDEQHFIAVLASVYQLLPPAVLFCALCGPAKRLCVSVYQLEDSPLRQLR